MADKKTFFICVQNFVTAKIVIFVELGKLGHKILKNLLCKCFNGFFKHSVYALKCKSFV